MMAVTFLQRWAVAGHELYRLRAALVATAMCFNLAGAQAATWYAAADGTETNGTYAQPWGVQYAVTNTNPHLQPGDTVTFKNGTYSCVETHPASTDYRYLLVFRKAGTPGAKITYQAENLWQFHFNGGLVIPASASNIVVRDFHIYFAGMATNRNVTNYAVCSMGINTFAVGSDILHNLIENTGHPGIGSWSSTQGKYIAGNVIRFIGFNDYSVHAGGLGTRAGNGMYLQQSAYTPAALMQGNISYYNYTDGMKAYGNQNINGMVFVQNVVHKATEAGIRYHQDQVDSRGVTIVSNYIWGGGTASGLTLGYQLGNANPSNAIVTWNYVVDTTEPISLLDDWKLCRFTNNILVNPYQRKIWSLGLTGESGSFVNTHIMSGNSYYAGPYTGYGTASLFVLDVAKTLTQWKTDTGTDNDATLTVGEPGGTVVRAFRPSTDTNFVHIVVFNWATNTSASVDLSSYFPANSRLYVYDAQNIPTEYTNFNYSGSGSVSLPLTLTDRATMLGTFTQRPDAWTGFDRRFRTFVVHRLTSRLPAPTALHVIN